MEASLVSHKLVGLSGQDYPLLPPAEILARLQAAAGRTYLRAGPGHAGCRSAAQLRVGAEPRWQNEFDVRAITYNAPCLAPPSPGSATANVPIRPRRPWLWAQQPEPPLAGQQGCELCHHNIICSPGRRRDDEIQRAVLQALCD